MQGMTLTASTAAEKRTLMEIVGMLMNKRPNRSTGGNMSSNVTPCEKQLLQ